MENKTVPPVEQKQKKCLWEKDNKQCDKKAIKEGYCQEHYEARGKTIMGGTVGGIVLASFLTANPVALIGAAILGGVFGASANRKDNENE